MRKFDVAIIHTGEERRQASKIANVLRQNGVDVWLDLDALIDAVTPVESVTQSLASARLILYLISSSVHEEPWCKLEAVPIRNYALEKREDRMILPIRIEPCDIPLPFLHRGVFDLFESNFDNRIGELVRVIKERLERRLVFVCHSSRDKEPVNRLVNRLRRRKNIELWYDSDALLPGNVIRRGIESGIARADYLLAILSQNVIDTMDGWIGFELDQAYEIERTRNANEHYFVIPVIIEKNIKIPGWLGTKVYADLASNYERGFEAIIRAIGKVPTRLNDG